MKVDVNARETAIFLHFEDPNEQFRVVGFVLEDEDGRLSVSTKAGERDLEAQEIVDAVDRRSVRRSR